jgi:hypothetical protein
MNNLPANEVIILLQQKIEKLQEKIKTKDKLLKEARNRRDYLQGKEKKQSESLVGPKRKAECFRICKRSENDGKVIPYNKLGDDRKEKIRANVTKYVCGGSEDKTFCMSVFIRDMLAAGRQPQIERKIGAVLEHPLIAGSIGVIIRAVKNKRMKSEEFRALKYCERKLMDLGKERSNKANECKRVSETIVINQDLQISPVKMKHDSYKVKKAENFLKTNFPNAPSVRVHPKDNEKDSPLQSEICPFEISVEHASVNPIKLFYWNSINGIHADSFARTF